MPMTQTAFHHATPVYEELDGWWEDVSKARTFDDLPVNAQRYVRRLLAVDPYRDAHGASLVALGQNEVRLLAEQVLVQRGRQPVL